MKLPQLSLRDLFWLVLVCGLALGWWIDRRAVVADLSDKLRKEGAALRFVGGVFMHQIVLIEQRRAEWTRDQVTIDGKTWHRADSIDPVELDEAAAKVKQSGSTVDFDDIDPKVLIEYGRLTDAFVSQGPVSEIFHEYMERKKSDPQAAGEWFLELTKGKTAQEVADGWRSPKR